MTELGSSVSQIEGCESTNTNLVIHDVILTVSPVTLDPGDRATECRCLTAAPPDSGQDTTIPMGIYTIKWRR